MQQAGSDPARDIELAEVFNLRDLGGYRTGDGRRVRWRTLYRGGALGRLRGADLEAVRALGWATVIDLRTDRELEAGGTGPIGELGAAFHHLAMIEEVWQVSDSDRRMDPVEFLAGRYRQMLVEGVQAIATTVDLLSAPVNLPAVFYCSAGKDRTGVMAALVLDALGVDHETIAADYHLSRDRVNRGRVAAARAAGAMVEQPEEWQNAPAAAMQRFLAEVHDAHGGAPGYLRSIGVPQPTIDRLPETLTEPEPG